MIRETFMGKNPSHFHVNSIVKAFIASETFLWSARNLIIPIFAVFAAEDVTGGSIELAASAFSIFLIVRVVFELITGKLVSEKSEITLMKVTIAGMIFLSLSYIGLAFSENIWMVFLFFGGFSGIGLGIASPAKNALFSVHLDKKKETMEWGVRDSLVFGSMAASAALGGFIAGEYGFSILFILASIINIVGIVPYVFTLKNQGKEADHSSM